MAGLRPEVDMYVSVSAYNDAELLDGCLASIRDVLDDIEIHVCDGRYETWPDATDNSSDETPAVAEAYDASYDAAGPFERENEKHRYRVRQCPEGERALFLDADERLHDIDHDVLDDDAKTAYSPRIVNALVYGPRSVYWPRSFYPETVESINRWDAYLFDAPHDRTDAITILHRHDLRDRMYRERKYWRFENEDRVGRYAGSFDTYLNDDWDVTFTECPECGEESVTRSQETNHYPDGTLSFVEVCTAGDGCYANLEDFTVDEWRYLPEDWEVGFREAPRRLRAELLDAGCSFAASRTAEELKEGMQTAVGLWIEDRFHQDGSVLSP